MPQFIYKMFKNPFHLFFFFFFLLIAGVHGTAAQVNRFRFTQPKMGSPFTLVMYAQDSTTAHNYARQAFALIDSLNRIFSDYDSSSELSRLSATAGLDSFVTVSPFMYDLLRQSKKAMEESNGTFDVTIGPLSRLWRRSRREKVFPSSTDIRAARALTGGDKIVLDTTTQKVKLLQKGMLLDAGGIGKGYIAQQVVYFLTLKGFENVLADAGGDIVCSGAPPGKKGWTVAVNVPGQKDDLLQKQLLIQDGAVATSGDVYQYTEHKGRYYAHIINPKTGYGVTFRRNVTVITKDGALADWLATACSILPLRKAIRLANKKGAALLVTQLQNNKIRYTATQSFAQYWTSE